ncbi:MAG: hypothetical protein Q8S43_09665 [Actinomycetota bacterium]|nr:MAG: hypothetical protein FD171_2230 [Actinomycetota bacterium]MDO8950877.1 hypothetical protein [Actinomycetota bacterium]MDP3631198.1 hypothetical protein [Actinomycetota bacterium]
MYPFWNVVPAIGLVVWAVLMGRGFVLEVRSLKGEPTSAQRKRAVAWGLRSGCGTAATFLLMFTAAVAPDVLSREIPIGKAGILFGVMAPVLLVAGLGSGLMIGLLAVYSARSSLGQ